MKELIELIAKALVDDPDQVKVSELEGESISILELKSENQIKELIEARFPDVTRLRYSPKHAK